MIITMRREEAQAIIATPLAKDATHVDLRVKRKLRRGIANQDESEMIDVYMTLPEFVRFDDMYERAIPPHLNKDW